MLIGGETVEMRHVRSGEYDRGVCVGAVERAIFCRGGSLRQAIFIGVASAGVHSDGFVCSVDRP